jgi:Flp pilus assembly pilin Flp
MECKMNSAKQFLRDESGAVTVDWVVLTAGIVGLGMIVFLAVRPAVSNLAFEIAHELEHAGECLAGHGQDVHCH